MFPAIFYTEKIITSDDYKFSESGLYYAPKEGPCDLYLTYIRSLPQLPHPEVLSYLLSTWATYLPKYR